MISLTFTNDNESFTIHTTRANEAILAVEEYSPTTQWPHAWPSYAQLKWGYLVSVPLRLDWPEDARPTWSQADD